MSEAVFAPKRGSRGAPNRPTTPKRPTTPNRPLRRSAGPPPTHQHTAAGLAAVALTSATLAIAVAVPSGPAGAVTASAAGRLSQPTVHEAVACSSQAGTVTGVGPGSITVKSTDGLTTTYTLSPGTSVDGRPLALNPVKPGDAVSVVAAAAGGARPIATAVDHSGLPTVIWERAAAASWPCLGPARQS